MKNLRTTNDVFHAWAHQAYPAAQCGNVSFRGRELYSYAACIAKLLPNNMVAHTTRTWSMTTSQHQSSARHSTNHMKTVWCYDPSAHPAANRRTTLGSIEHIARRLPERKYRKDGVETVASVKKRDEADASVLRLINQFNEYLAATGDKDIVPIPVPDNIEAVAQLLREQDAALQRQREASEKERAERIKDHVEAWKRHEPVPNLVNLMHASPALRLSKDNMEIETSWGARIPVVQAERMWKSIRIAMRLNILIEPDGDLPRTETYVGAYRINEFRPDGSIKVGCHTIAYSELEGMAVNLGLKEKTDVGQ